MYIHKTSKLLNSIKNIKEYRALLKEISSINLRRSSKFNILAVYGALLCMKDYKLEDNIGIYIATEHGPITDVSKVVDIVNEDDFIIMPFDFLNINTNNVSFYVSKVLNATGKNMVLTSETLGFEKTVQLAKFDLDTNDVNAVLIGTVDESLEDIQNYSKYVQNPLNKESKDGSCWIYANNTKENSIAKIEYIYEFDNIKQLENISFDTDAISLNTLASLDKNIKLFTKNKKSILNNEYFGCEGVLNILSILEEYKQNTIHIAKDKNGKIIVIKILLDY